MMPPKVICPACGSDQIEPLIGEISHLCENCGHWFRVINGQAKDDDDTEDEDVANESE